MGEISLMNLFLILVIINVINIIIVIICMLCWGFVFLWGGFEYCFFVMSIFFYSFVWDYVRVGVVVNVVFILGVFGLGVGICEVRVGLMFIR